MIPLRWRERGDRPPHVSHRPAKLNGEGCQCNGELRYPAWQFTEDPAMSVLSGLAQLTPAWGDQKHPSTILGFMYNADLEIEGTDETFTPIEWLTIGGDVQVVLDYLEAASWS